ncbi:MAG: Clp protease N-terminal domain-containing protein [Gemmatimonadaceae bacterium]
MNGYNFTERVRKVLAFAREEAAGLRHEYVGTEHLLLGIIREGEGVASTVLSNLNVKAETLRETINEVVKHGVNQSTGPDLPYTSRAKKVLELSMSEARNLNHAYVGTEHLLLGLLREEKGVAAQTLVHVGVTLDRAREETLRILGSDRHLSPVKAMAAMFRKPNVKDPWEDLPEPLRRIVKSAFVSSRAAGRATPGVADLLEATILSSRDVSAALTSREIEIESLIADVRARQNESSGG